MDARARSWTLSNATGVGDSPTILGMSVVTTPSVAMGLHLIERLRAAGMTFEVKD